MSFIAAVGGIESGIIYAFVAFGVLISFRILDFPDLTVDGSFPLGAAVTAILIISDINPWLATLFAIIAGAMAGITTAMLHVYCKILPLLASILVMIALYSINLRIMGRPNIALLDEPTIATVAEALPFGYYLAIVVFLCALLLIVIGVLWWFFTTQFGLRLRATGSNPGMSKAQGININLCTITGMALSNALVGFAGSLFAQTQGTADISLGVGTIIVGLAAVIGGEALISNRTMLLALIGALCGALLYRLAITLALQIDFWGIKAQDLNLLTAVLVTLAIIFSRRKKNQYT